MLFPFVPFAPGVPPVNRNAFNSNIPPVPPATSDSASVISGAATQNQWGVFDQSGASVLDPDSVFALDDFNHEFVLSTFPIEEGSFSTYNKVAKPFEARLVFNKGGSLADRSTFMDTLESVVQDTNLYVLSTPERAYQPVNIPRYRLRRRAEAGFQLISVEVTVQEIRVATSPAFSNTQDPTAQTSNTTGAVQPAAPTGAQVAQAQGAISPEGVGTLTIGPPAP